MNTRLPVRWRLTIWNAAFTFCVLLLFGIAIYAGQRILLYDHFDEQAQEQANLALSAVIHTANGPALTPETITSLSDDEHFVRLIDASGNHLTDTSTALGDFPLDPDRIAQAMRGDSVRSVQKLNGKSFVIWTVPVRSTNQIIGVLQTGTSRSDADETLRLQLIAMLIAAPIILLATGVGAYILAGRALKPVEHITNLASTIGVHDLHARLNLPLPNDELGRLARTFDSMLGRIEDAFERQRRFTGDAAHELRTPLSMMQGQIDLALARNRTPEEHRQAFVEINEDLARLTKLVETLLALARSDAPGFQVEPGEVDVAELIELVADQYAGESTVMGITLTTSTSPATMLADSDLLVQLLVNLTDNAMTHTNAGGTIELGCRPNAEDDTVHLWVKDTGIGIAPQHLEHVFDRFYRADPARSRSRGGAGLGLAICRSIVEAHHGHLEIESRIGQGTILTAIIPRDASSHLPQTSTGPPPLLSP